MIAVINYGMGNTGSIINMLHRIGTEAEVAERSEDLAFADKIILPGVGTFDTGMGNLEELGFAEVIREEVLGKGKPILGICLGMQLLGNRSEEGEKEGLALIDFDNVRFSFAAETELKIPHMGWDIVDIRKTVPLVEGIMERPRYYFVHSYHAVCRDSTDILMSCSYGYEFTAAVNRGNIYGTQFHPEKSHRFGMKIMENFVRCV